ncbi:MAG: hypothetical protein WKG00_15585 [Polyangiaceae bacterium]
MSGSRLRSSLLAAALVAGAIPAHAQSSDKAMAESLFQAGRALMKQNKPGEACPKFAESNRVDPSPGTLLNLGKCLEATGKTASAWAAYKEAIVLARSTGQSKHVTAGTEFAAAVEPRLSYLKIDILGDRRPGMVVKRDGTVIGDGALGVPIAVDPGEHIIEASAPGHATWRTTVTIGAAAEKKDVEVPLLEQAPPGAEPAPTASTEPAPGAAPSASSTVEPPPIVPAGGSSTLRTLGFVGVGVGLAGIAVGTVFGVLTLGEASDAEGDPSLCPQKRCSQDGLDKIDAAETKALVSTLGLAVGGAAAVAGVVMLVVSGKRTAPSTGASAAPRVSGLAGPRGGGLTLTGSF